MNKAPSEAQAVKTAEFPVYEYHELADLFPRMRKEESEALRRSILKGGQSDPIILYEGKILDGINRYEACRAINRKPLVEDLPEGTDPLQFVIEKNAQRRHLTAGQKAWVADQLCTEEHGGVRKGAYDQRAKVRLEDAAKMLGVSTRLISMVREVKKAGFPILNDFVRAGRFSLSNAKAVLSTKAISIRLVQAKKANSTKKLEELAEKMRQDQRKEKAQKEARKERGRPEPEDVIKRECDKLVAAAFKSNAAFKNALTRLLRSRPAKKHQTDILKKARDAIKIKRGFADEALSQLEKATKYR